MNSICTNQEPAAASLSYREFVSENYDKIKVKVVHFAFMYRVPASDVLSLLNQRMSVGIKKGIVQFEHVNLFWGYIQLTLRSVCIELIKATRHDEEIELCTATVPADIDVKLSATRLISEVLANIKVPLDKEVFVAIMITGEKYGEVAERLGMNINNVKTIIHRTRSMANKHFRDQYLDIVA